VSAATKDISSIAKQGIALIENKGLACALEAAYDSPEGTLAVAKAHHVFKLLTSSKWPVETICRFLSGWHSTHGTALFVGGLIIRIHREARKARERARPLLYEAAAEIGEVIPEDTGVDDIPHHERFAEFATYIVGDDRWQLGRYTLPACRAFRDHLKDQRLAAPVERGILAIAASENWNTGEYTYLNTMIHPWIVKCVVDSAKAAKEKAAYISVHAGQTELRHFLHALKSWDFYCQAKGKVADPMDAKQAFERHLRGMCDVFGELEKVFE
jgi:hypothetical protein